MSLCITIEGTLNETAISKFPNPEGNPSQRRDKVKELAKSWFEQEDPRWFERDNIFHGYGVVMDKTTKVIVEANGEEVDKFKLNEHPELLKVTLATGNGSDMASTSILAMENSRGTTSFTKEGEKYKRQDLCFEITRVGGLDIFATNLLMSSAQYYIVSGIRGFTFLAIDSGQASSHVLVNSLMPFSHPTELSYNQSLAAKFRKVFLSNS